MTFPSDRTAIAVVGAGPAGLAAALAIASRGHKVTLIAPRPRTATLASDSRTFAALGGSVDLLKALGAWPGIAPFASAITTIRIVDDRGGLLRAPEVRFNARELGQDNFGHNIPHAPLIAALSACVLATERVHWLDATIAGVGMKSDAVELELSDGRRLTASLVVAADGRHSLARTAANIETAAWSYPQSAIACTFQHTRRHDGISTELHRLHGPLTTVPLPDQDGSPASSLVWVEATALADDLNALDDPTFAAHLETRLQGLLGRVTRTGRRATFALSGLSVTRPAGNRVVLVGEAAHVIPPIGAQGLNLGLRDAATIADCLAGIAAGADPGSPAVLDEFCRLRAADIGWRVRAVDALNRSLIAPLLPFDALRGLGLHALAASAGLRKLAMYRGLEPVGERPSLMRSAQSSDLAECNDP